MFENIRQRWSDSGSGARIGFFIGLLAIALLFAGLIFWMTRDDYQVLFSDLAPQDAATMISELERMKIAYRLEEGGKSILVDKDTVYKTRLKLMGKGVNLRGTVGFEIFNNTDFGTTEFAQKINYQRALQGELARTIMDFEEIKFARVHLVMPESGLFRKSDVKPKASVSLVMRGDSHLSREQVQGIQRLVAASVPAIDPASVTILDQHGVALTRMTGTDGEAGTAGGRLETKKQIEIYLTRKIADMLDKAVGPGQAIVSVDATLTQDSVKITREDVIPLSRHHGESAGAVVRSRESRQNSSAAKESDAAAPKGAAVRGQRGGTLEVEYQNGRKVEQIVSMPGSIKRISVGVLLPDNTSPDQLEKIRKVVTMAAGIDPARGDSIAIYSIEQYAAKSRSATLPSESGASPPAESGRKLLQAHQSDVVPALWIALASAVAFAFGAMFLLGVRKRRSEKATPLLSEAERLEALAHIRQWIGSEGVASKVEAGA